MQPETLVCAPGPLRNGNPRGNPNAAPRCGAKTRLGCPCKGPAMKNGRCRMHGGASTGPKTAEGKARIAAACAGRGNPKLRDLLARTTEILRRGRVLVAMMKQDLTMVALAPLLQTTWGLPLPSDGTPSAAFVREHLMTAALTAAETRALVAAIRAQKPLQREPATECQPDAAKDRETEMGLNPDKRHFETTVRPAHMIARAWVGRQKPLQREPLSPPEASPWRILAAAGRWRFRDSVARNETLRRL